MRICHACDRHVFGGEDRCPFCDVPHRTSCGTLAAAALFVTASLGACSARTTTSGEGETSGAATEGADGGASGPSTAGSDGETTAGSDGGGSVTGDGDATATSDSGEASDEWGSADDGGDGGGSFYGGGVDGGIFPQCGPGLQDCPNEDEKCTAYTTTPGECCVDANKCVPIIGDKEFGEPCTRTWDNDDCAKGLFCMPPTNSGDTGDGTCVEFCRPGIPDSCESGGECFPLNGGALPVCQDTCDPRMQDCEMGLACYPAFDSFICTLPNHDPGVGGDGDDCVVVSSCQPGLVCTASDFTADCMTDACCTPFCDVSLGTTGNPACPDGAEECVPWFDMNPPMGLEDVGACGVP